MASFTRKDYEKVYWFCRAIYFDKRQNPDKKDRAKEIAIQVQNCIGPLETPDAESWQ